jgi:hypothetical protein
MGANVPGKVREQLLYLAGVDTYAKIINEALDGWKGFNLIKPESASNATSEEKSDKVALPIG